ncbi:hypothetical protein [Hydrogenophaga sp. RWCD_12]|uniref:hypothetical protein n=1 Tax=Hydrogenophaga sp. RWCD_12 TaxID=3391190 RepID=UPI0039850BF1
MLLFYMAWSVGWALGEAAAIRMLSGSPGGVQLFIVAWLIGWTLGGLSVASTILWQLAGKEIVDIGPTSLVYRIEAAGMGWTRSYRLADVRDLRVVPRQGSAFSNPPAWTTPLFPLFSSKDGWLAFDYGARTIRLGTGLDEAEAKSLAAQLKEKLPKRLGDQ